MAQIIKNGILKRISTFLFTTLMLLIFQSNAFAITVGNWDKLVPVGALIALGFALVLALGIMKKSEGNEKMVEIAEAVRQGADAFLRRQYISIAIFMAIVFALLFVVYKDSPGSLSWLTPIAFLTGGFSSGLAGFIGMKIATRSNARTAHAAQESLNSGLQVAFSSGTVMGMTVVGLGLLFTWIWFTAMNAAVPNNLTAVTTNLFAFGMGASSVALFARLGGGIYTKAADVGADLVGKVEAGIPEDDPRNPATIADNVGDNVGDVAGMGADLYESYVGSVVATMSLGASAWAFNATSQYAAVSAPMVLAVLGIFCSILGRFLIRTKEGATQENLLSALRIGIWGASAVFAVVSGIFVIKVFSMPVGIWTALMVGLVAGNIIGYFTEVYTSDHYKSTKHVAESAETGGATVIIAGLAVGMRSTVIPVVTVVFATLIAYISAKGTASATQGLYGIGMAAVGMLSTLGITLATDAYGPVADNAGGVAEMAGLDSSVREKTDALDSLGNTTAATGKGFAIGSAALTALTLMAAYYDVVSNAHRSFINSLNFNVNDPVVISGLFIGAVVPFLFSAMTMEAVGSAAMDMVQEVRRQFREIKGIMEGTTKPDYQRCVDISTTGALKQMIAPSILALLTPIVVGIFLGPAGVMAMLAGTLVSGFALAIMMANAGGSWDNAKKYIEKGNLGGKGSDNHKAAVIGDTVGDPFKDTSGPSINILIKLMSVVSIVFGIALLQIFEKYFADLLK